MANETKIIILERRDGLLKLLEWIERLWQEAKEFSLLEVAVLALTVLALSQVVPALRSVAGAP